MTRDEFNELPEKISLIEYPFIRYMIRELRNDIKKYSAEDLSVKIGKSKGWIAQIENGRLKSITKSNLLLIMSTLSSGNFLSDNIEDELFYAVQYYKDDYERSLENDLNLPVTEDVLIKRDIVKKIFKLKDLIILDKCNKLTVEEQKNLLYSLEILYKNIDSNIALTCILLSLPVHAITNNETEKTKKFIDDINLAFTSFLSSTLNNIT